jgi:hypothetical protein
MLVKKMKNENRVNLNNANGYKVFIKEVKRHIFKEDSLEAIVTIFNDGSKSVVWVTENSHYSL